MQDIVIYESEQAFMTVEHLYTIGGYASYEIFVKSNKFSGVCNFCISDVDVNNYIKEINTICENLTGSIQLKDCESDAFINFAFETPNFFKVEGQIGGSYESHMFKFEFRADISILYGLKRNLLV